MYVCLLRAADDNLVLGLLLICFADLQSLAVHPDYQGRGIGKQLVEAGLEYVDETEKAAYLESSPAGAKLYPRCGFEVKETMSILDGATVMSIMVRPAKTKISNDSSI